MTSKNSSLNGMGCSTASARTPFSISRFLMSRPYAFKHSNGLRGFSPQPKSYELIRPLSSNINYPPHQIIRIGVYQSLVKLIEISLKLQQPAKIHGNDFCNNYKIILFLAWIGPHTHLSKP